MEKMLSSVTSAEENEAEGKVKPTHVPVMLNEVLDLLATRPAGRYLDGTLGLGGHARAVLRKAGIGAELLGLDRDAHALEMARMNLAEFGSAVHTRQSCFADFPEALDEIGWDTVDGALVDLGVSSMQLDTPGRGFSFLRDGPLDMRMDPDGKAEPASALVNAASVGQLTEIIENYGEEPMAGRIARAIDEARARGPIETTLQLAAIVERAYPAKWRRTARNHPATKTFQALRLAVNGELEQLKLFLERIVPRLAVGGRVAVISFHSLEDRIVKHFFKTASTGCICPPQQLFCVCGHHASLRLVTKKALTATDEEMAVNARSRSAKLRVAERIEGQFSLLEESARGKTGKSFSKRGVARPEPRLERKRGIKRFAMVAQGSDSCEADSAVGASLAGALALSGFAPPVQKNGDEPFHARREAGV